MKAREKRVIELGIEKAKEWYNKGGELKEVALQAYTEKELNAHQMYGDLMFINGMRGYIIGFNEYGVPNVWLSERLKICNSSDLMSKGEALGLKFNNGWHIPSFGEMEELKEGILAAAKRNPGEINYVMWNTSDSDTICWWGIKSDGSGIEQRHVHAILKK